MKEIALKILLQNQGCHICGSLGLNIQEIKTSRQPSDIDINIPYGYNFKPIEDMEFLS